MNNSDDITITPATLDHIAEVAPLFDLYRVFYGQDSNLSGAVDFLTRRLVNFESAIYIARAGDQPAGFTQLYPSFSSVSMMHTWILNDLFVHPDFRRRGIGRQLMHIATTHASNDQAKYIMLKTGVDNTPAQALYESEHWDRDDVFYTYVRKLHDPSA